jgi:hypothetical protein
MYTRECCLYTSTIRHTQTDKILQDSVQVPVQIQGQGRNLSATSLTRDPRWASTPGPAEIRFGWCKPRRICGESELSWSAGKKTWRSLAVNLRLETQVDEQTSRQADWLYARPPESARRACCLVRGCPDVGAELAPPRVCNKRSPSGSSICALGIVPAAFLLHKVAIISYQLCNHAPSQIPFNGL